MSDPIPSSQADVPSIVTVLVADDQRLVREGIASLLDIQEGISVVGEAVNGQEAIEKALALHPDVILMDVRMPVMDGIVATADIHRQLPGCQVIMLTTFDDDEYIVKSLRGGLSATCSRTSRRPTRARGAIGPQRYLSARSLGCR